MINLLNIAYLQDIDQSTPENTSGELLVFPYQRMLKRQTSPYGPCAHPRLVQDVWCLKHAYVPKGIRENVSHYQEIPSGNQENSLIIWNALFM